MNSPESPPPGFWNKAWTEICKLHDDHPEDTAIWAWLNAADQIVVAQWQGRKQRRGRVLEGTVDVTQLPERVIDGQMPAVVTIYDYRSLQDTGELVIRSAGAVDLREATPSEQPVDEVITVTGADIREHDALLEVTRDVYLDFLEVLLRRTSGEDRVVVPNLDT